jgi:hypothetical protein
MASVITVIFSILVLGYKTDYKVCDKYNFKMVPMTFILRLCDVIW